MAIHNLRGIQGEDMAAQHLTRLGYHVQHRNWRYSHYEIDIIATKNNIIHFVEVKTKHSLEFGYPEEEVTKKKFKRLEHAAEFFLHLYPYWKNIQFDILAITRLPDKPSEFYLIEDVYFY